MPKITEREFEACYDVGKRFYTGEISRDDGVIELVDNYQMRKSSAEMYIQFFRYAMNGERHVPPISTACLEYYLKNVLTEFGKEQLKIFLQGLEKHIKHRQEEMKLPTQSFCELHNKYSKEVGLTPKF